MVPQMTNTHHEDLASGKESSIWDLKLTKELRNDMELASTYLLETHPKEIKLKTFPPF